MLDLNRPEQSGLTGSSGLPPSPFNSIPLCLPRYKTGIMVPWITVVVSEIHEGFEAVSVMNPAGGDVIVVPFPLLLAVVGTEELAEARLKLPLLGACVGEKAIVNDDEGFEGIAVA